MEFMHEEPGGRLRLSGKVSGADLPDARQAMVFALELGTDDLILDVDGVSVSDVNVLGLLLEMHRRAARLGRRLVLANVPPELDRLLRRTKVGRVLNRLEDGLLPGQRQVLAQNLPA